MMSCATGFLAANEDLGDILEETIGGSGLSFRREGDLFRLGVGSDPNRVGDFLHLALSEAERDGVYVVEDGGREHAIPRSFDEWWRRVETAWFGDALRENRFSIWYQPIYDTRASSVMAHQCSLRLVARRTFHPSEIVETAIARGELHQFGVYARRLAVESAAVQRRGVFFIDVLADSIYRPSRCLKGTVDAVRGFRLASADVVFCFTEAELIRDSLHVRRICDYLRGQGCWVALGQVGAGGICGSGIRDLRPDFLKIDRTLARNAEQPASATAIRKLVELADRIGCRVVAEGVERVQTMENLWLLGVECMQGFLFGSPAITATSDGGDVANLALSLGPAQFCAQGSDLVGARN